MSQIGRPLDPWQAAITLDAFGVRRDGLWSAFELLIGLARQNGKGGATEAVELGGLFLFREPLILHSAHQFKTSTSAFRRLQDIIDGSDWLTRRVRMISRSKGDESIELTRAAGGGRLQFVARTLGSGRGLTGSKNIFDEAAWLTVGQYAAQTPTLSTIPNPQIIYTSTPPDEDVGPMPEDAMLPSVRARGLSGGPRIAMYEWSPPETYDRTDPDLWYDCNPALGIRISEWFLRQQLEAFSAAGRPEKFDTEHLGVWPKVGGDAWTVITETEWRSVLDERLTEIVGTVAFGLEVSWDRQWSSLAAAGRRADGLRQAEVMARRRGTAWVVAWAVERIRRHRPCAFVVDPGGPAASLIPDLEAEGIEVFKMTMRDFAAACSGFYDGVAGKVEPGADPATVRNLRHLGDEALTAAVAKAVRRKVGNSWVFERDVEGEDMSPLIAATLALQGHAMFGHRGPLVLAGRLFGDED